MLSHLGRDASLVVDSAVEGFPYEATVATYALDECLRVDALYALWKDLNLHFDVLVVAFDAAIIAVLRFKSSSECRFSRKS